MIALLVLTGIAAALGTAFGTAALKTRAPAWGLNDVPNARSLHTRVTPRGGGIVLVLAVIIGVTGFAAAGVIPLADSLAYGGCAVLVAAIGWRDDLRSVPPGYRLLVHLAAAACAISVWGTFTAVTVPGVAPHAFPQALGYAATVLWIVGLLNAYNFMDGIDGIAAGQAVVGGLVWVVLGLHAPLIGVIGALVAAASLGFIWHNWSPARIFMGDAGSGFLGFSFAVLPLILFQQSQDPRWVVAGMLVVAPFVFDTTFTLIRRALRGENITTAHRTHIYQRLVLGGWTHARVAVLYLGISAVTGAAAVLWMRGSPGWVVIPALLLVFSPSLLALAAPSSDN